MKTYVLTLFLCVVLAGVVYSALVACKPYKSSSLMKHTEVVVNTNSGQFAQVSLLPVDDFELDF